MGHRRSVFLAAVISLATAVTASASAISFSSTSIDWSGFSTSVTLSYTDQYSIPIAEANANGVQAPQVRNDLRSWGDVSATNSLVNTLAYGFTAADLVYAEGNAKADGVATFSSHASSFVGRGGYFTLLQDTELNFSVPFTYLHTISLGSPADSAYAQSMLFLSVLKQEVGGTWSNVGGKTLNFYDQTAGSFGAPGVLTLDAALLLGPGNYAFDISAFAAAAATVPKPVPEPTTVLLLGLGAALVGVSRRLVR